MTNCIIYFLYSTRFHPIEKFADFNEFLERYNRPIHFFTRDDYIKDEFIVAAGFGVFTSRKVVTLARLAGNFVESGNRNGERDYARFRKIDGIITNPYDTSKIWVMDTYNYCIREINRRTKVTSTLTGQCGITGHQDGEIKEVLLTEPVALTIRPNQAENIETYFYDNENFGLKSIKKTGELLRVHTVVVWNRKINSLCFDPSGGTLYLVYDTGIGKLVLLRVVQPALTIFFETKYGFSDGLLNGKDAKVKRLTSMAFTINNFVVLTDEGNSVIRLLDLEERRLSSICRTASYNDDVTGSPHTCHLKYPKNLLPVENGKILILGRRAIFALRITSKLN